MAKYLDNDGLLYFWQKIKNLFATKSDAVKNITRDGMTFTATRADNTTFTFTQQDMAYADFTGATSSADGAHGLVPAPSAGSSNHLLFGSGGWKKLNGTFGTYNNKGRISLTAEVGSTYTTIATIEMSDASASLHGLMSPTMYSKLSGIEANANNYTHPSYTAHSTSALYKFTNDAMGHVDSATAATASDIVALLGTMAVSRASRATADASGNNIADTYAKKTDIAGMYRYMGSVANEAALPTTGMATGDVYNIEAASSYGGAGANVAWNGTAWDSLGEVFTIVSITNSEIDTIVAS